MDGIVFLQENYIIPQMIKKKEPSSMDGWRGSVQCVYAGKIHLCLHWEDPSAQMKGTQHLTYSRSMVCCLFFFNLSS